MPVAGARFQLGCPAPSSHTRHQSTANATQVWFGSRVVMLVVDPELGRLVNRNPNRHAYPHLGDLKSKADNASFFSSITTARECEPVLGSIPLPPGPMCMCAAEPVPCYLSVSGSAKPSRCHDGE